MFNERFYSNVKKIGEVMSRVNSYLQVLLLIYILMVLYIYGENIDCFK